MSEFQRAAAAARRRHGATAWVALPVSEQAKAIYAELRRIDAGRVTTLLGRSKRHAATPHRIRSDPVEA